MTMREPTEVGGVAASFVAYIDESGDEGFSFASGSSTWFVVSAAIVRKEDDLTGVALLDGIRRRLGKPERKPLHFRDIRHEQRLLYIDAIANSTYRMVSVLAHKPSLRESEVFTRGVGLYFHLVRYLLERVSWHCRDHPGGMSAGDGSVDLVFSNRSGGMAYDEMRDYLAVLEARSTTHEVSVDWSVVRPTQVAAHSPGKRAGLQIADAVASSLFYAVQPSRYGFTESRYARMLLPVTCHHRGSHRGYGIRVWPREAEEDAVYEGLLGEPTRT